jgi:CII-binding regulator of phage lambda lysogenization HflD
MARADVEIKTDLNTSKLKAGLAKAKNSISKFANSTAGRFLQIGAVIAGVKGLGSLGKMAMEAEEVSSKFNAVFGDSAKQMAMEAENLRQHIHSTTTEMKNSLATYGAIAQGMGMTTEASAMFSVQMAKIQGDLASFHNLNSEEAFTKISSAISGEFEPMKRLGIVLNVAKVEQEAFNMGITDGTTKLTQSQKALATQSLIIKMMGQATGDAEATTDSSMNAYKRLNSQLKNFGEQLGENIIPMINTLVESLAGLTNRLGVTNEHTRLQTNALYEQAEANLLADGTLKKFLGSLHTEGNMFAIGAKQTADRIKINKLLKAEIDKLTQAQEGNIEITAEELEAQKEAERQSKIRAESAKEYNDELAKLTDMVNSTIDANASETKSIKDKTKATDDLTDSTKKLNQAKEDEEDILESLEDKDKKRHKELLELERFNRGDRDDDDDKEKKLSLELSELSRIPKDARTVDEESRRIGAFQELGNLQAGDARGGAFSSIDRKAELKQSAKILEGITEVLEEQLDGISEATMESGERLGSHLESLIELSEESVEHISNIDDRLSQLENALN